MAEEKTRYSDAELAEFKELILKKLETARADYELLRATITHTGDNDTAVSYTHLTLPTTPYV